MNIGLDIDNVIADFDSKVLEEFYIEDKNKRNKGIINPNGDWIKHQFDWTEQEIEEFFNTNMERIAKEMKPKRDAKYYMDKLLEDGHKLYLISHRAHPHYKQPFETTVNWLKTHDINYTKLVLSETTNKSKECLEYNIDIMFDDIQLNCYKLQETGINCYLVQTKYNINNRNGLKIVKNWRELYNVVCNIAREKLPKIHVILDTDINNEADDQFALSYLLKSKDRIILDAVTIAPYSHENNVSIEEGTNLSYNVAKEVFRLCNENSDDIIYKGSIGYISNGYNEENQAVNKIIEIVKKNKETYILAIGAITNIALAIKKAPEILEKIKIIWLGGHSLLAQNNREYNFKQDIQAVREVFYSGADLTVIPCQNVASNLVTTIFELQHYFDISKGLGKFLYDRFYNDGIHGITQRRVIWDISVIAYIVNPYWFETKKVKCPTINDKMEYKESKYMHKITFVNNMNVNEIYKDMFKKIGENY